MRAYAIAILGISKLKKKKNRPLRLKGKIYGVFLQVLKKEAMKIRNTIRNNTLCIPKH